MLLNAVIASLDTIYRGASIVSHASGSSMRRIASGMYSIRKKHMKKKSHRFSQIFRLLGCNLISIVCRFRVNT